MTDNALHIVQGDILCVVGPRRGVVGLVTLDFGDHRVARLAPALFAGVLVRLDALRVADKRRCAATRPCGVPGIT